MEQFSKQIQQAIEQADTLNRLDLYIVLQKSNHLRGSILTIIDAVIGGDERLKPTKDLIHREINLFEELLLEHAYLGSKLAKEEVNQSPSTLDQIK